MATARSSAAAGGPAHLVRLTVLSTRADLVTGVTERTQDRVNGLVTDAIKEFAKAEIERKRDDKLTYQEVLTVMAFEACFDRAVHDAVLETGLAVDPEQRHPSMDTLLAALRSQ